MARWFRVRSMALLVCALPIASPAAAEPALDPVSERANNLFKKGKQAYEEGKDQESYRMLREAWALRKSSDIAANLALIESELGKYRDAAEHYAFALRNLLPSSTDAQKQALLKGLEQAKKYITALRLTVEPTGAEITVNEESVGKAPLADDIFVDPGEYIVSAKLDGFAPLERRVSARAGGTQVVWLKLDRAGAESPARVAAGLSAPPPPSPSRRTLITKQPTSSPPEDRPSQRTLIPAIALGGVAVIAATSGVIFTLEASSSQTKAEDIRSALQSDDRACIPGTPHGDACKDLRVANQSVEKNRNLATISFVVAGAAGLGTIVYLLWPESDSSVTARAALMPGHGELTVSGRF